MSEPGYKYHVGQRVCLRKVLVEKEHLLCMACVHSCHVPQRIRHGEIPDPTLQLKNQDSDSNSESDVEEDIVSIESTTRRPRRRAAIKSVRLPW